MSGFDPEDPSLADEVDPQLPADEPWVDDEPDLADDLTRVGEIVDDLTAELAPVPADDPPMPDVPPPPDDLPPNVDGPPPDVDLSIDGAAPTPLPTDIDPPGVDLSIEHPPEAPPVYEVGTLVTQFLPSDDLAAVEAVTTSDVYEAWVAGGDAGGGPGAAVGGFEPGSPWDRPGMVGDAGDVNFWFQQNSQFSCGPSSAAQIISDFTGNLQADESLLAARALERGWYDPASGMTADNLANLLDDQGVPSTVHRDQDFTDLEQYLREGRAVVMFLDARDVMPATGFEAYVAADQLENSPEDTVDHFVRVIGIDRAAGVAILANPGYAGAAQVEIPLDQLEEAWNDNTLQPGYGVDRAHILIVSDAADATPDDAAIQPTPQPQPEPQPGPGTDPQPGPQPGPGTDPQPGPQPGPVPGPGEPAQPGTAPEPGAPQPGLTPDLGPSGSPPRTPAGGEPEPTQPSPATPVRERVVPAVAAPTVVTSPVAAPGDIELPDLDAATPAGSDGLFDSAAGWVLIPVTFAAGRVSAALRRRR